jgi:hypothetical protein
MTMKRFVFTLLTLIIAAVLFLYTGLSSKQTFSKSVAVACTNEGALRVLVNERNVKQGWPGEKLNDSMYRFEELQYTVGNTMINTTDLIFEKMGYSEFVIEATTPDSSRFTINYTQQLPLNPLNRIKSYLTIRDTKQKTESFLTALKQKFDGEEFVYGIKIEMGRVTDSAMISTRKLITHLPSVSEIYEAIDAIRTYIKKNGGEESSAPMLNVFEEGKNQYLLMVAVPTKTIINGDENFLQKRMLANGFILMSEVAGGNSSIQKAEQALRQYVTDHRKTSPAIPFQMLLTDRRSEPDTSKWKTRLYYPVMY